MKRIVDRMGQVVLYTPTVGDAFEVKVVFSAPPKDVLQVDGYSPYVEVEYALVPSIKRGDIFEINNEQYKVINKDQDVVSGLVKAYLEKQ